MHHDMLERRFSHQAQVQALKMRTEAELARRAPQQDAAKGTTRQIVTKTVVVKVPPSTTAAPATTAKPAAATTTTAPTTTTPTKPTTTTSSSSSSTTTTSTTPTSRATTSSTTSTIPKPANTTNRNVTSPTSSAKSSPTVLSPTVDDSSSAKAASGLSSGATGGIIAGVVLAALVVILFVVRKTYIRRRERKRNTWGAGLYPSYNDKDSVNGMGERQGLTANIGGNEPVPTPITSSSFGATGPGFGSGTTPRTADWRNDQLPPVPPQMSSAAMNTPSFYITPPPASYNNAVTEDAYGGLAVAAPVSPSVDTAVVTKMYHPTLADELAVTVGEVVQVLRAFDDGWALCQNIRGDKGVVPLQCLDWAQSTGTGAPQIQAPSPGGFGGHDSAHGMNGDWRNMKRLSSLSGHGPQY